MEEKNGDESRKCVVKDKRYDFYYRGKADYVSEIGRAIHDYNQLPEHVRNDFKMEVIFLDTPKGLELLAEEN